MMLTRVGCSETCEYSRAAFIPDDKSMPYSLPDERVHLWIIDLCQSDTPTMATVLSKEELLQADRYYRSKSRRIFKLSRTTLRHILALYLKCTALEIEFEYTSNGKPILGGRFASSEIKFNLSKSGERILIAISANREIGVDIEEFKPQLFGDSVSGEILSAAELSAYETLAIEARAIYLAKAWTRKEAVVKAIGDGMSLPMPSFEVQSKIDKSPIPGSQFVTEADNQRWSVVDVPLTGIYFAALASNRPIKHIMTFHHKTTDLPGSPSCA